MPESKQFHMEHLVKEIMRLNDVIEARFSEMNSKLELLGEERHKLATAVAVHDAQRVNDRAEIDKLRKGHELHEAEISKVKVSVVQKMGWGGLGGSIVSIIVLLAQAMIG
jgi:hypothetical protein